MSGRDICSQKPCPQCAQVPSQMMGRFFFFFYYIGTYFFLVFFLTLVALRLLHNSDIFAPMIFLYCHKHCSLFPFKQTTFFSAISQNRHAAPFFSCLSSIFILHHITTLFLKHCDFLGTTCLFLHNIKTVFLRTFFQNCKFFPHQKWDLVSNMYTFIDWSNPGLSHCIHPSWHFNHFVARC